MFLRRKAHIFLRRKAHIFRRKAHILRRIKEAQGACFEAHRLGGKAHQSKYGQ